MKAKNDPKHSSLALWLGQPAPRYTSYPPAPYFQSDFQGRTHLDMIGNLPKNVPVSLYIHIPFCRSLCLYCGCNTAITQRNARIEAYLEALKTEVRLVTAITGPRQVSHLHFGGGTPNILSDGMIRDLFGFLKQHFSFEESKEIAIELDPRSMTKSQVETLIACGVTRVSLGVQDFDPEVQEMVKRIQPFELVAQACTWLRNAGIKAINFDLMYGLPKQTPETVTATALRVIELNPDRIALFSYAHVPEIKTHQRILESYGLPDDLKRLALDQILRGLLITHGYHAIGMDHFARSHDPMMEAWRAGKLHRNYQGYTEDNSPILLGFGASAISQTNDGYFQNERDATTYISSLAKNELPVRRGLLVTDEDRVRRAIIEQLMCTLACDVASICENFNFPIQAFAEDFERLIALEEAGLIMRRGHALCLVSPHRMAIRIVCLAFDRYSTVNKAVSSRAA